MLLDWKHFLKSKKWNRERVWLRRVLFLCCIFLVLVYFFLEHSPMQHNSEKYFPLEEFFNKSTSEISFKPFHELLVANCCQIVEEADILMTRVFLLGNDRLIAVQSGVDARTSFQPRLDFWLKRALKCSRKKKKKVGFLFHLESFGALERLYTFLHSFQKPLGCPIWVHADIFGLGSKKGGLIDEDVFLSKFSHFEYVTVSVGWFVNPPRKMDKGATVVSLPPLALAGDLTYDLHSVKRALSKVKSYQIKQLSFHIDSRFLIPSWDNLVLLFGFNNQTSLRVYGPLSPHNLQQVIRQVEKHGWKVYFSSYFPNDTHFDWTTKDETIISSRTLNDAIDFNSYLKKKEFSFFSLSFAFFLSNIFLIVFLVRLFNKLISLS